MKKIIYVGNFSFPNGNAAGTRVLGIGYLLKQLGYELVFVGVDHNLQSNSQLKNTAQEYDGFKYYNFPYPTGIIGWISYKQRYKEFISLFKNEDIYAVISYGSPTLTFFANLLRKWCIKNRSFYLVDCHDWFESNNGSILHRFVKNLDNGYEKKILNVKSNGVIAISTFLAKFYQNYGCKTVVIPPLVNSYNYRDLVIHRPGTTIKLIYVGIPFPIDGRKLIGSDYKDRIDKVIETLYRLKELDFLFSIYGITIEQYLSVIPKHKNMLGEMKSRVVFNGKISNDIAISKIASSDFTILFRDLNRMTSAGFPTKFVESISCGTPVITTKTSDLQDYLIEGENGFFLDINNQELLDTKLTSILTLEKNKINLMKECCIKSELFSYENYKEKMHLFLNSISLSEHMENNSSDNY